MDLSVHGALRARLASALLVLGTGFLAIAAPRPELRTVSLTFAGDVMLGRSVGTAHASDGWAPALRQLAPYAASTDLAFANLESPLSDSPLLHPGLDLRASPEAADALSAAGFSLVSLANNHALDAGAEGLAETRQALTAAGLLSVGPDSQPVHLLRNGLRLTWIALDDTTNPLDLSLVRTAVAAAHASSNLIVVSVHWGSEWDVAASPRQRLVAGTLASAGADIVVGHHPHVLQPIEWIWGDGRGRPTLVAYSLGNTLFDQASPPATRQGALLLVAADAAGVRRACALPFEVDPHTWTVVPARASTTASVERRLSPGGGVGALPVELCPTGRAILMR